MMNERGFMPPERVRADCRRGISLCRRYDDAQDGMTGAADKFSYLAANGFPVDAVHLQNLVDAHAGLDRVDYPPGEEPVRFRASRLLWGGDTAVDWARACLADLTTEPLAAAAQSEQQAMLDDLAGELFDLDGAVLDALRAAFWVSYRRALRSTSTAARSRAGRVPLAAQAAHGLGPDELDEARQAMRDAGPFAAAKVLPDHVAAAIDLDVDQAVQSSLTDFEEVAAGILVTLTERSARLIARRAGVDLDDVRGLQAAPDLIVSASQGLRQALLDWVRDRLSGDRAPDDLVDLEVPEDALADAVAVAGGEPSAGDDASIAAALFDRTVAAVAAGSVTSTALRLAGFEPVRVTQWHYGDPGSREHGNYQPHLDIDGVSWASPEERVDRIGSERPRRPHRHCRCRLRRRYELRRIQGAVTP